MIRCVRENGTEIRRMTSLEGFVCERENFVLNSLIYFEPMKRFESWSNTMKVWSRKIEEKRVTVINFGMNERCGDSRSCSAIHSTANTAKVANIEKAGFGDTRDMLSKRKIFIKDDTKVTSRINRSESDIVWKMNCRKS